jgi:UPF0042 nucleotide-binding protein
VTHVVVITGLSGAGRTQVGNALEDLGWFVMDNLPASLIPKLGELLSGSRSEAPRVALILGSGNEPEEIPGVLTELAQSGVTVRTLFLDASTDVLIRRYESTRRRHPFAQGHGLGDAIEHERRRLSAVREHADVVIDTSNLTIHELRSRAGDLLDEGGMATLMRTTIVSFGYKYGLPSDVDFVIDCRFLPNPFWDEVLRPLSGQDHEVVDYLTALPETAAFLDRLTALFELLVPRFREEGKAYLTIALGCTGGRHRSVAMAEALAHRLAVVDPDIRIAHRDIER